MLASVAVIAFLFCQFAGFANATVRTVSDSEAMASCGMMGASLEGDQAHHPATAHHGGEKAPLSKMVKAGCNCFCAVIIPSSPMLSGQDRDTSASGVVERSNSLQIAPPNRPPRLL
jgi:hypothetical protein